MQSLGNILKKGRRDSHWRTRGRDCLVGVWGRGELATHADRIRTIGQKIKSGESIVFLLDRHELRLTAIRQSQIDMIPAGGRLYDKRRLLPPIDKPAVLLEQGKRVDRVPELIGREIARVDVHDQVIKTKTYAPCRSIADSDILAVPRIRRLSLLVYGEKLVTVLD